MFHHKWKKIEQAEFLINISHCLDKGYSLSEAVKMQSYEQHPAVQRRISTILQDLKGGLTLSDAFLKAGFPKENCSFLYYSMYTGQLANGFLESGRYLKLKEQQKQQFSRLMRYPLFLLWLFAVMAYIVIDQLLPSFRELYRAMSIELPYSVKLLLAATRHLGTLFIIVLVIIGFVISLIILYTKTFTPQQRHTHLSKIPYLSSYLKMYLSYYFSFHLGCLMKVGLPVNQALELIEKQHFLPFFKQEARSMREALVNGLELPDIIKRRAYYTRDLPLVIRNGELQGHLGEALEDYSQILFNRLDDKITRGFAAIQPIFFILFGGLIIGLFLSILTPMFSIIKGL